MTETFHIFTLGCKVNQYETQGIREQLLNVGFEENDNGKADIYVINTCTVTRQADAECRRLIRKAIRSNPRSKIVVTGCYAEKNGQETLQFSDRIQVVPNQKKHQILKSLQGGLRPRAQRSEASPKGAKQSLRNDGSKSLKISGFRGHQRAFVKIQDGCDNFCAYCIIPYVRGRSRSRSLKEIKAEVEGLVNNGYKEIVLSGICLGDYRYREINLVGLLSHLEKIQGEFRIRLSSIEQQLISDGLIEKIAYSEKICPHLHIPLQSGDNAVLKRMNRRYTVGDYLSLITMVKKKIKDLVITTDILVGFPGETDKNFRNTVRCLEKVLPLRTHIFPFSPRPATAAFNLQPRLNPKLIQERANLLKEVANKCSYNFRKRFLGRQLTVLVESQPDKESKNLCGYSENFIRLIVECAREDDINKLLFVRLKKIAIEFTIARVTDDFK